MAPDRRGPSKPPAPLLEPAGARGVAGDVARYASPGGWAELAADLRRRPPAVRTVRGWVRCEPGWTWRSTLPEHDLWTVVAGRGTAYVNGAPHRLRAGVTLLLRPGDTVDARQHPADRLTVGYAHYARPASDQATAPAPPPRVVQLADPHAVQVPLRELLRRLERPDPAAAAQADLALAGVLLEVDVQAARAAGLLPPPMDARIRTALERLRDRPAARPSLAAAAAAAGLSAAHFARLFRTEVGASFRETCVRVRMDRARDLLRDSALPAGAVAAALGYTDYRLFARQFADHAGGLSPARWRATAG